jgi:hypothetical protein
VVKVRDRRSIKVVGLAIAAAGLLAAVPAALGNVYGGEPPNAAVTLQNPILGRCYPTSRTADKGVNDTDITAQVFKDSDCKQLEATLAPGQSDRTLSFASVKFTG